MGSKRGNNEGSIYERKDRLGKVISYQAQLSAEDGRRTATFKTKREALRWLSEQKMALLQGRLGPRKSDTVGVFLDGWLDTIRPSVKPRTHEVYSLNVRRVLRYLPAVKLPDLKPPHVQKCYNSLLDEGLSPRTVQQAHMVLHKALRDAIRLDLLVRNVTESVTVPRPRRKEMATLSALQLQTLFEATKDDRFHALWVLLGTAGLRIGEALGLKWEDFDAGTQVLEVRRSLQRQNGVGLVLVDPKTKLASRTVPLTAVACQALQRHQERQLFRQRKGEEQQSATHLIFCTESGKPLDRGRIHLNLASALKKAGLPKIRIHDLRHTAATLMREEGVDVEVVQRLLGHSSITVTLDVYTHVAPSRRRDAAERMDDLFERISS